MAIVGYARVSDSDQSLAIQLDQLTQSGCTKIFQEKKSGTKDNHSKRDQLQACLDYVREGDVLVVTRLDRLGRSTLHLCQISALLESKGVALRVLEQNIDTTTATGKLMFNMLATIAEFETSIRADRQREGIAKAKSNGVQFGREMALSQEQVTELKIKREQGIKIKDLMKEYKLSKATIYRYLKVVE
jgi:DNA invertase Pin-like site-specific DNA recombinase